MSFEQPKRSDPAGRFVGSLGNIPADNPIRVLTLRSAVGDEEPATVRGSLVESDSGMTLNLSFDYADLEPVGWTISGPDIPTYTVTGRDGKTLTLEVA